MCPPQSWCNFVLDNRFWEALNLLVVFLSAMLIVRQLRLQSTSHLVSTVHVLDEIWKHDSMIRARYMACESWLNGNVKADATVEHIFEFLEQIATYYKLGALSKEAIWEMYSWYIEHYWQMFGQGVSELRDRRQDPTLYCEVESVVKILHIISRERQAPTNLSIAELVDFAQREMDIAVTLEGLRRTSVTEETTTNEQRRTVEPRQPAEIRVVDTQNMLEPLDRARPEDGDDSKA